MMLKAKHTMFIDTGESRHDHDHDKPLPDDKFMCPLFLFNNLSKKVAFVSI